MDYLQVQADKITYINDEKGSISAARLYHTPTPLSPPPKNPKKTTLFLIWGRHLMSIEIWISRYIFFLFHFLIIDFFYPGIASLTPAQLHTKKTFCGFSMGRNQYWAGRVYDLCVYYMTGTPEGSTKSVFMEKPGIEPATLGLQGIALIHTIGHRIISLAILFSFNS